MTRYGAKECDSQQPNLEAGREKSDEASQRREARYLLRELANLLPFYQRSVEEPHYTLARDTLMALSASYCDEALGGKRLENLLTELRTLQKTMLTCPPRAPKKRLHRPYA